MRHKTILGNTPVLAAFFLAGCFGRESHLSAAGAGDALPATTTSPALLLLAAEQEGPELHAFDLPPLGRWPLSFGGRGPVYAFVQLAPYVGQLGVLAEARRADTGTGFGATFGYRVPLTGARSLGFELICETSSHHNEASDVDGRANRISAGARLSFRADQRIVPFAVAGAGYYELRFEDLGFGTELAGPGLLVGGGVDYVPVKAFTVRLEMNVHVWDAADDYGHGGVAATITIGLGAGTSF